MIGLLKAAETYDPSRGASKDTWFSIRVYNAILDGIREHEDIKRGRRKKYPNARKKSLDRSIGDNLTAGDMLVSRESDPAFTAEQNDTFDFLTRGLSPRQRYIAKLYMLDGLMLSEVSTRVALDIGGPRLTKSRLSQLVNGQIIPRMREKADRLVA